MPAKSKKQLKFMQAIANNPAFAKKVGVPTKVGKEFSKEKNMKKGNENALMKKVGRNMAKAKMQEMSPGMKMDYKLKLKEKAPEVAKKMGYKKGGMMSKSMGDYNMKKGGSVSNTKMGKVKSNAGRDGVATRGKTKGKFI
jgi:hypothetical protein